MNSDVVSILVVVAFSTLCAGLIKLGQSLKGDRHDDD